TGMTISHSCKASSRRVRSSSSHIQPAPKLVRRHQVEQAQPVRIEECVLQAGSDGAPLRGQVFVGAGPAKRGKPGIGADDAAAEIAVYGGMARSGGIQHDVEIRRIGYAAPIAGMKFRLGADGVRRVAVVDYHGPCRPGDMQSEYD